MYIDPMMRVLISALILVLVLHFLLDSIAYRRKYNLVPHEGFDDKKKKKKATSETVKEQPAEQKEKKEDFCDQVIFTNGRYVKAAPPQACFREVDNATMQPQQELLDYVQCKAPKVSAANVYVSDQNDANFQSDVMNLNRFYQLGAGSDQPSMGELATSYNQPKNHMGGQISGGGPGSGIRQGVPEGVNYSLMPNTWRYENELPMNGGAIMPGVSGYDELADYYTPYNQNPQPPIGTVPGSCAPPQRGANVRDDLRMGMGAPFASERETGP
jgi:hypothetical protein